MSYLVLARKYRPQTFADIVGQEHVTRTLANAFAQDRVHHAFLFCGPRGVGKTTAARVLGKALNCEKGPTADPCNECEACLSIGAGTAVDYREMDGASNRGIDAIRELKEAVRYQPAVLNKKVYVIDEVHMLTTEAFNALLKTLEEPPPHVCFVLATTEPHKLPNTILSRCQRYDFRLVPQSRLAEYVLDVLKRENIETEPAAVSLLVRESGGSVRDAMSLCDQVISYAGDRSVDEGLVADVLGLADRALTVSIFEALVASDAKAAIAAVDAAVSRGIDEVQLARAQVRFIRDVAVIQAAGDGSGLVEGSPQELADYAERASALEPMRVRAMFERMLHACDELGRSQQPRLALDLALIDLAASPSPEPIGGLIDRLEGLERRLARGGAKAASPSAPARPSPPPARSSTPPSRSPSAETMSPPPAAPGPQPEPARAAASVREPEPAPAAEPAPVRAPAAKPPRAAAPAPDLARPSVPAPGAEPAPARTAVSSAPTGSPPAPGRAGWERFISDLEAKRRLSLVGLFQEAKLLCADDSQIEVGFARGSIGAELASEREKLEEMAGLLKDFFGRPLRFSVVEMDEQALEGTGPGTESVVERDAAQRQREVETREREAREHPMTRLVLSTFGASIKEIKTDV